MTANEMANNIELLLNIKDQEYAYEDIELSSILNKAQVLYVGEFSNFMFNANGKGFEETEARGWGLAPLIKPATLSVSANQTGAFPNGIYYDLPVDFDKMLTEYPKSNKTKCNSSDVIYPEVTVVTHDEYNRYKDNYYRKPYIDGNGGKVWRMYDNGRRLQLVTNGSFAIVEYKVKYLQSIPNIVVDRAVPSQQVNCVLESASKEVHEAIVEIAVRIIRKSNSEQSLQDLGAEQVN